MPNIYLEKIANRVAKRARKFYDETKEVYDDGNTAIEIKKKLTKKNNKAKKALNVQAANPVTKKRMTASGRKWNRGTIPQRKKR